MSVDSIDSNFFLKFQVTLARATVTEQMAQLLRDIHASMLEKWVSLFFPTFSVLTELIFGFFLLFFAFAQRHQSAERAQEDHPRLQRLHSGAGQEERHPGALLRRQDVRGQDQEGVDAVIRSSSTRHWLVGHQFLFMLFFFHFAGTTVASPALRPWAPRVCASRWNSRASWRPTRPASTRAVATSPSSTASSAAATELPQHCKPKKKCKKNGKEHACHAPHRRRSCCGTIVETEIQLLDVPLCWFVD